jgi:hypothetical protein
VEVGRKEGKTSERVQVLGLHLQREKAHMREVVRKANKVVGCVWGIGERKWGGDFMKENDEQGRERIDVRGRDLGMEGTREGRESARKILRC